MKNLCDEKSLSNIIDGYIKNTDELSVLILNLDKANMPINDDYNTLYRNGGADPKESRANTFAANFLMPPKFIAQEAKRLVETPDFQQLNRQQVIQRMADRFRVSYEAMKWRLINLKYIDKSKV